MFGHRRIAVRTAVLAGTALALVAFTPGAAAVAVTDTVWTIAGGGREGDGGPATLAVVDRPRHVSQGSDGSLYVTEPFRNRVRRVSPDGVITTFAGTGQAGFSGDGGLATAARLSLPHAAVPLADGSVVIADTGNNRVRRVLPNGTIDTALSDLGAPRSIAGLRDGGYLVPDTNHHCIRRIDAGGSMSTVAGTCGTSGFAGDGGLATSALLHAPFSVEAIPGAGFLIADIVNQRVRLVDAAGIITTVAGDGGTGHHGDGAQATATSLSNPHAVFPLPQGGFVIADTSASRVRVVSAAGTITTLAGTGVNGYSGDNGAVGNAALNGPKGVLLTQDGYLLIADELNGRIRAVGQPVAPRVSQPPKLSGRLAVFSRLTASLGTWKATAGKLTTPGPGTFDFQWQRCGPRSGRCSNIPGERESSYVARPADIGWRLRVRVTATNSAGSASGASARTPMLAGSASIQPAVAASSADGSVSRVVVTKGRAVAPLVRTRGREIVVARTRVARGTFVSVGLLRFDTSAVPETAKITSVKLQLDVLSVRSRDPLRLLVEPYPASRWPIGRSDFAISPRRRPVADYAPGWLRTGTQAGIPLRTTAVDPRTPTTAFRLLLSSGTVSSTNTIRFAAGEHRALMAPTLHVEYTVRAASR